MTKLYRLVLAITVATTFHFSANAQSLSVNTTGAVADPSAILDVTSTAKGMLIPRMDKTQKNAIATPANGLLIYQTAPDSIGFHYYDLPNTRWVYINTNGFATDTIAWKLTGNSNVADTSFLGSKNNKALRFKVFDTTAGIVDSTSGNAALGYRALRLNTAAGFYANNAIGFGAGQNLSSGFGNSAMGRHALSITGASTQNVAIGDSAMARALGIGGTTAIGFQALKQINGLGFFTYNTAVGYASQSGPTGTINGPFSYYNTSVGGYAMADNMAGYDNVAIGVSALRFNDSSSSNTAIGINAMAYHKRSGFNSNVAVGSFALENDSIGFWNTVVGAEAMQNAKTGGVNTAIGFRSMRAHKVGGENTAVGVGSLEVDSSGTQNTAVGRSALFLNKAGTRNTVVGAEAGVFNNINQTNPLQGSENTYVGFNSGRTANIGRKNAVVGAYALEGSGTYGDQPTLDGYSRNSVVGDSAALRTFGNDNVAMGFKALNTNTNGSQHVAVGSRALAKTTATYPNTAVGYSSMDSTTTGSANTAIGSYSLTANKTGINNVAVGNAAMFQSTAGSNNVAVGNDAGRFIRNNDNTAIGGGALRNDSTGFGNTSTGAYSSFNITSAIWNTANGYFALENDTTGSENTAMGTSSFRNIRNSIRNVGVGINTGFWATGSNNTYLGSYAGEGVSGAAITGGSNTAVGDFALRNVRSASQNVAVGESALGADSTGNLNVAVGAGAMDQRLRGNENVGVGFWAGRLDTASVNSVYVGSQAGYNNNRSSTVAIGYRALYSNSFGASLAQAIDNVAVGTSALVGNTLGSSNTAVGNSALLANTTGNQNTSLGYLSNVSAGNLVNATAIGANSFVAQSNSLVLGSINGVNGATADTKVGIGTTTPDSSLSVADNFLVGSSGTVQYANSVPVMNYMFKTGSSNADRMVVAHSPAFPTWGLQYQDATDQFNFIGSGINKMVIELGSGQVGIGMVPTTQLELSLNSAQKPASAFWTITSDERLKTIDGNYTKGLKDILKLNTIMYHYTKGNARKLPSDEQAYGFSAQEVQKIFPEAVKVGEDGYLGLDLHPVFVSYINAFKEQQQIIDKQQKTIDELIKRVEKLEQK
jgi:trimeric autotransporter adhesin